MVWDKDRETCLHAYLYCSVTQKRKRCEFQTILCLLIRELIIRDQNRLPSWAKKHLTWGKLIYYQLKEMWVVRSKNQTLKHHFSSSLSQRQLHPFTLDSPTPCEWRRGEFVYGAYGQYIAVSLLLFPSLIFSLPWNGLSLEHFSVLMSPHFSTDSDQNCAP